MSISSVVYARAYHWYTITPSASPPFKGTQPQQFVPVTIFDDQVLFRYYIFCSDNCDFRAVICSGNHFQREGDKGNFKQIKISFLWEFSLSTCWSVANTGYNNIIQLLVVESLWSHDRITMEMSQLILVLYLFQLVALQTCKLKISAWVSGGTIDHVRTGADTGSEDPY